MLYIEYCNRYAKKNCLDFQWLGKLEKKTGGISDTIGIGVVELLVSGAKNQVNGVRN
ncbi:MAG: hypothetical protein HZB80_04230 [Deltaproteobacteria bacterium]|nr:hypothetical protein [Deltaproteobacteria bacterium]